METVGLLVSALCFMGIIFFATNYGVAFAKMVTGMVACTLLFVALLWSAGKSKSKSLECESLLDEFVTAVEQGGVPCLLPDPMSAATARGLMEERLVSLAKDVILSEHHFGKIRGDHICSVLQVVNEGLGVLEAQDRLERSFSSAVQFGVCYRNKRPIFSDAEKQLAKT
ncbi:MAG: hypothetical protein UY50_C0018G0012 [Parcubacteria group bacterium GW2011_GWA2_49_9]|nr:MAG: hypothetical protein UY50_C0018G0012 [Parcubacteria group bacterium GW2011_GWA2_49_9]